LGRKECGAGWEGLQGGCGLEVCGCETGLKFAGAGRERKKFQPAQDSRRRDGVSLKDARDKAQKLPRCNNAFKLDSLPNPTC